MGIIIEELKKLDKNTYQIIDIRDENEIAHGAIPGAVATPADSIEGNEETEVSEEAPVDELKELRNKLDNIIQSLEGDSEIELDSDGESEETVIEPEDEEPINELFGMGSSLEKELLQKYKLFKIKPLKSFGGASECFSFDILEDILNE